MNPTARCLVTATKNPARSGAGKKLGRMLGAGLLACSVSAAYAGAELKIGDDASLSVGIGLRTSFTNATTNNTTGTSQANNFAVENMRLYVSGSYGKYLKATFNTERTGGSAATGGDGVRVMDAIAQFEFMPAFNFWLGRMLPPSDRSNLDGPFYIVPWSYPGIVSNYPGLAVGRDNGATVWGKPWDGKIVYSLGAFNGHNRAVGLSNTGNSLLYAGRLAINFLDAEPAPAYYTGSSYGGGKDIFTIGLVGQVQKDGVGTTAAPANLKIWNVDVLFEKKLSGGYVPTLEGAYYRYDTGGKADCGSGEPGAAACPVADNVGGQVQGKAYLAGASFLFPQMIGWGQLQPYVRYQKYNRDLSATTRKGADIGLNYLIKGPNAKVSLTYTKFDDSRLAAVSQTQKQIVLGVQLQY